MSNSSMVVYKRISPNKSSRNGNKIRKITPHHCSGVVSIETLGSIFAPSSRQASSTYGIGNDGRVGQYVDEADRPWTSSSYANDCQAVTIEVSNSVAGGDWPVSNAAWNSLVDLCVDICKRNGIPKLIWTGDSTGNLTMHKMFANTDCPGPYLERRMPELAALVNARLGASEPKGWVKNSTGWWWSNGDGTWPSNAWKLIDNYWYWFNGNGYAVTGWAFVGGYWYYFEPSTKGSTPQCSMKTGWVSDGYNWFYCRPDKDGKYPLGSMVTGWLKEGEVWYYLKDGGYMAKNETLTIGGKDYAFDKHGHMYDQISPSGALSVSIHDSVDHPE